MKRRVTVRISFQQDDGRWEVFRVMRCRYTGTGTALGDFADREAAVVTSARTDKYVMRTVNQIRDRECLENYTVRTCPGNAVVVPADMLDDFEFEPAA